MGVAGHDTGAWPIVQPVYGYYMVPWADHRVAVGATVEDVGFAADVTAGGVHDVLRETLRVMPGLAGATWVKSASGCGRSASTMRRYSARCRASRTCSWPPGTAPNGLLLGPVSGALVADVVCGS